MRMRTLMPGLVVGIGVLGLAAVQAEVVVSGTLEQWHPVVLTLDGPEGFSGSEGGEVNLFSDRKLDVVFSHAGKNAEISRPGYFAADGNAGESGADAGGKWRVKFMPLETGEWTWAALWKSGKDVALEPAVSGKTKETGEFAIAESGAGGVDLKGAERGLLEHPEGDRYLRWAGSGRALLKAGPGSPENLLAFHEFDGTYDTGKHGATPGGGFLHKYEAHVNDWKAGDPTWRDGKGKGLIGAVNYIASKGMRSIYFLTYTIDGGDGKDVWPWTDHETRDRFDCSKLDQWDVVFSYLQEKGIVLNLFVQETENDQGLDEGELGRTRKLYFRELVARFGHHPGLIWNLGEENTNTAAQINDYCHYFRALDSYVHPIAMHTYPNKKEQGYAPLLGFKGLDIVSLQTGHPNGVQGDTLEWLRRSGEAGWQWVAPLDEIGPANRGVDPDSRTADSNHKDILGKVIWGNLMSGGSGVEHYFGYKNPHADLNCEDWRSREKVWDFTRYAVEFFDAHVPYEEMESMDLLTKEAGDYVFAKDGSAYLIYSPAGGEVKLDLSGVGGEYSVKWFDPQNGGDLQDGAVKAVNGGGVVALGKAPSAAKDDWVVLVKGGDGKARDGIEKFRTVLEDAKNEGKGGQAAKQEGEGVKGIKTAVPPTDGAKVHVEQGEIVAVEAESFYAQTLDSVRKWYVVDREDVDLPKPDKDPVHLGFSSGDAYLEILPDTRTNHGEKLIRGENFMPDPGKMAVLSYAVEINTPGRYYVWVRAYSTNSEDNGIHVGLNGEWPISGQRLQWCEGKNSWRWESKQRTQKVHCGVPGLIYLDIKKKGLNVVQFSMREDGFEFDKFILTTNREFARPDDGGADAVVK